MKLSIREDSKNYACQVIALPHKVGIKGLDNLVEVTHQGNSCLVGKDSNEDEEYLFFPAGCVISGEFLKWHNLYRNPLLNNKPDKTGFFEDNGRVKAIKFKGVISTGFIIPLSSLHHFVTGSFKVGDEFTTINGNDLCWKYIKPQKADTSTPKSTSKIIDEIIDSKFAPEHIDTSHLLKNVHKLNFSDEVTVSVKTHGSSGRVFNSLIKRRLRWFEKILKKIGVKIQEEEYAYIVGSRRVIKSINFKTLDGKKHYYDNDLWSKAAQESFEGKLNKGEGVYFEIIGKTYDGADIQKGYSYGLDKPKIYIYRITNINPQGIEIDLSWNQVEERAKQLGLEVVPTYFKGSIRSLVYSHIVTEDLEQALSYVFYDKLLEKPSVLDKSVVEEGFCIRVDKYPTPLILKIKSKKFLLLESNNQDKEVIDIEEEN